MNIEQLISVFGPGVFQRAVNGKDTIQNLARNWGQWSPDPDTNEAANRGVDTFAAALLNSSAKGQGFGQGLANSMVAGTGAFDAHKNLQLERKDKKSQIGLRGAQSKNFEAAAHKAMVEARMAMLQHQMAQDFINSLGGGRQPGGQPQAPQGGGTGITAARPPGLRSDFDPGASLDLMHAGPQQGLNPAMAPPGSPLGPQPVDPPAQDLGGGRMRLEIDGATPPPQPTMLGQGLQRQGPQPMATQPQAPGGAGVGGDRDLTQQEVAMLSLHLKKSPEEIIAIHQGSKFGAPKPLVMNEGQQLRSPTDFSILAHNPKTHAPPAPPKLAQLIAMRDALPPGHPDRAIVDQAIRTASSHAPGVSVHTGTLVPVDTPDGPRLAMPNKAAGYSIMPGIMPAGTMADQRAREMKAVGVSQQAGAMRSALGDAMKLVGPTSAGAVGAVASKIPGTTAVDLRAAIDTLKANLAFQALAAMRDASATGGALGQIAVQELQMLQATVASLDPNQHPTTLKRNLAKVQQHIDNWEGLYKRHSTTPGSAPDTSAPAGDADSDPFGLRGAR